MVALRDTPGVYVERVDATAPRIAGVRTDIAAFVGIARRGPLDEAIPVESLRQFYAHFGLPTGAGYLAYAVQAFFEGGGRRSWCVRIAAADAAAATALLRDDLGAPAWRVSASSPGVWGDELSVQLRRSRRHATVAGAGQSHSRASVVGSITGFRRGSLVEIAQPGATPLRRVVSTVDERQRRLHWVHPDSGAGLPYDAPLVGLDLSQPLQLSTIEYELLVFRAGRALEHHADLSLIPEHPDYGPERLARRPMPPGLDAADRLPAPAPAVMIEALTPPDGIPRRLADLIAPQSLGGGRDGLAALAPEHFLAGIATLDRIDEIAIVAAPDIVIQPIQPPLVDQPPPPPFNPCIDPPAEPPAVTPPRPVELPPVFDDDSVFFVQAALVAHCERHDDRFALLDLPLDRALPDRGGVGAARAWRRLFDTRHAAFYYPWLEVPDPLRIAPTRRIPPSGHVAGSCAKTDLDFGVHRAAANQRLRWLQGVTLAVSDAAHGLLNGMGVNVIRPLPGRGLRIMGARTASSDPSWRFVNVQRLLMMIKKALDLSTQWVVFEPNDALTRTKVTMAIDSYLAALFAQGAFAGADATAAYFVKCDEQNNPPDRRARGQLVAEVGIAPALPFEFIVLRLGREANQLEIAELGIMKGAA
jgi:hypothetical protein